MVKYKVVSEWGATLARNQQKHKRIKWCWSTERAELFESVLDATNAATEAKVLQVTIKEVQNA